MTEEPTQAPTTEDAQDKAPDAITAFIVVKAPDGSYIAISDLTKTFTVARTATLSDIRQACDELRYTITKVEVVNGVMEALKADKTQSSETKED
jgi:hypothetical protein